MFIPKGDRRQRTKKCRKELIILGGFVSLSGCISAEDPRPTQRKEEAPERLDKWNGISLGTFLEEVLSFQELDVVLDPKPPTPKQTYSTIKYHFTTWVIKIQFPGGLPTD